MTALLSISKVCCLPDGTSPVGNGRSCAVCAALLKHKAHAMSSCIDYDLVLPRNGEALCRRTLKRYKAIGVSDVLLHLR